MAAAVCPEGKLAVGATCSSLGIDGRSRFTRYCGGPEDRRLERQGEEHEPELPDAPAHEQHQTHDAAIPMTTPVDPIHVPGVNAVDSQPTALGDDPVLEPGLPTAGGTLCRATTPPRRARR